MKSFSFLRSGDKTTEADSENGSTKRSTKISKIDFTPSNFLSKYITPRLGTSLHGADKTGPQYKGDLVKGKACGKGVCTWTNGDTYEGDWQNSRMHGRGVYIWKKKGCTYDGEYMDGLMHGQGLFRSNQEGVYEGEFAMGMKDGQGKWEVPGQQVYVGEYKADKRHGLGSLTLADGSSYEGQWVQGKFHGEGVWTWNDGRRFEGLFDKDFPVEGVLTEDKAGILRTQSVQWDRVTHCMIPVGVTPGNAFTAATTSWAAGFTMGAGSTNDEAEGNVVIPPQKTCSVSRTCFQLPFNAAEVGTPEAHKSPAGFGAKYCAAQEEICPDDKQGHAHDRVSSPRSTGGFSFGVIGEDKTKKPRVCPMLGF